MHLQQPVLRPQRLLRLHAAACPLPQAVTRLLATACPRVPPPAVLRLGGASRLQPWLRCLSRPPPNNVPRTHRTCTDHRGFSSCVLFAAHPSAACKAPPTTIVTARPTCSVCHDLCPGGPQFARLFVMPQPFELMGMANCADSQHTRLLLLLRSHCTHSPPQSKANDILPPTPCSACDARQLQIAATGSTQSRTTGIVPQSRTAVLGSANHLGHRQKVDARVLRSFTATERDRASRRCVP